MRILYVSPYPPARDGIGDYTAALVGEMRRAGHEPFVIAAAPYAAAPAEVIGVLPVNPLAVDPVRAAVAACGADIVHVQFGVAAYAGRIGSLLAVMRAVRGSGIPVIVTLHEVLRDTALLRGPGRGLYRTVVRLADRVVLHTDASMEALRSPVGARTDQAEVVHHPRREPDPATVTTSELRERHELGSRRILLAFGFIHIDKGLDDLVDAMARLRTSDAALGAGVVLVVAGDVRRRRGPFRIFEVPDRRLLQRVHQTIAREGLGDTVTFIGYVPPGEVAAWFSAAEVAVLPYRRTDQSGVATLAAAARTPVLLSQAGGLTEGSGAARWSFPPRSPARLAEVIATFLRSPEDRADATPPLSSAPDLQTYAAGTLRLYARCLPVEADGSGAIAA